MSEIIGLVREINEVTKRQISVVHAMASLPESERMRFWHEQFIPLGAQEHALREQLQVVGQGRTPTLPSNKFLKRLTESPLHLCRSQLALTFVSLQI
jgi:hypothetical protein